MPRHKAAGPGLTHLRVTLSDDFYIGPGRADLLELIAESGSISEAARRMGMSYKRAWGLVQALNEGFGASLIETQRGGVEQGAALTPAGAEVLKRYRHMQAKTKSAIVADVKALGTLMTRASKAK
jgi:molybdate transport system regulatory protein